MIVPIIKHSAPNSKEVIAAILTDKRDPLASSKVSSRLPKADKKACPKGFRDFVHHNTRKQGNRVYVSVMMPIKGARSVTAPLAHTR